MCGRFTYRLTWREIVALCRLTAPASPERNLQARYNICLSMANSQILAQTDRPGQSCEIPTGATVRIHEAPAHTRRPPVGHHRQTRAPGRSTRRRGRILVAKASRIDDREHLLAPDVMSQP